MAKKVPYSTKKLHTSHLLDSLTPEGLITNYGEISQNSNILVDQILNKLASCQNDYYQLLTNLIKVILEKKCEERNNLDIQLLMHYFKSNILIKILLNQYGFYVCQTCLQNLKLERIAPRSSVRLSGENVYKILIVLPYGEVKLSYNKYKK